MATCIWTWILKLCIFTSFLNLCATQSGNMKNVARNKSCGLSSQYTEPFYPHAAGCTIRSGCVSGNCSAAINGNDNTNFNISANPPNCIHTTVNDQTPFWWVDLGQPFVVSKISILGRKNYISRMVCVNISVDGQLVKRFTDTSGWNNDRYDVTVGREGTVINITKDCSTTASRGQTINICEVQVWVCDDGWYGDCTQTCGHCAGNSACDKLSGRCASCDTGFQPPLCQECLDGRYGDNCTQTCGNCAEGPVCDKVDGRCKSCIARFQPPLCKGCAMGFWGDNCSCACGDGCENRTCDAVDGSCTCVNGWATPRCEASSCPADTDRDRGSAKAPGPVGAIAGSISGCVIGFLLGMLFMRFRLRKQNPSQTPANFSAPMGTVSNSSAAEEKGPARPVSADYENAAAVHFTSNVYDSLKASPGDNVYTELTEKGKDATQLQDVNF